MKALDAYVAEVKKATKMLESLTEMFDSAPVPEEGEVNWPAVGSLREFNRLLEYTMTQLPDPIASSTGEMVPAVYACSHCGERRIDLLTITEARADDDEDTIHCATCHTNYPLP